MKKIQIKKKEKRKFTASLCNESANIKGVKCASELENNVSRVFEGRCCKNKFKTFL